MATKPLPELEGRDVLCFREGTHKGVTWNREDFDSVVANVKARGQDIAFAPVEDDTLPAHSLKRRIGATVPLDTLYEVVGKHGKELRGRLKDASMWLREQAADKPWPYLSPTLWTEAKDGIAKMPGSAYIRSLSPTGTPAITPQTAWLSDDNTPGEGVAIDLEDEPQETTTSQEGTHIHLHLDGNGNWKPDTKKELTDMADEKKEEVVETPAEKKIELSDLEKRELKLADDEKKMAARQLELSKAKVRRFAEVELSGGDNTKLHPKQVDEFVTRKMKLNLDDTEADEKGKTALDYELDWECASRGNTADFSDTAEIPEQNEGGNMKKDEIDQALLGLEDLALAGQEFSDEAEQFDQMCLSIQAKLGGPDKCSLEQASNLAEIHRRKKAGE